MIIFFPVAIKDLFIKGRKYPWSKPCRCPRCNGHKLWGHGFTDAWFDDYPQPLLLKRYRCPACKCIIRMRPEGYFKRFRASIKTIRLSISKKLTNGKWLSGISRTRQCHWLNGLYQKTYQHLSVTWGKGRLDAFDILIGSGHIPVSRSIKL